MKVGIIGLGDMGRLYARKLVQAGLTVVGVDLPEKLQAISKLRSEGIEITADWRGTLPGCELVIFSVETRNIGAVVSQYSSAIRKDAIVAGQTAVKSVEIEAFERHLAKSVSIITCHSLHGPSVDTQGQKLILINHRSSAQAYTRAKEVFAALGSRLVELSNYKEHDRMTADIQAATHLCFESMGTAWKNAGIIPWKSQGYASVIDEVKILMALRIFASKAHVYSEIAILNPFALEQVENYARSVSELFKLMLVQDEKGFRKRVSEAGEVFSSNSGRLLTDEFLESFHTRANGSQKPNSHLSLLAMADSWRRTGVDPYQNLVCRTPPYMLRVGIAEYLFRKKNLLEEAIQAALQDRESKVADLEFHRAVFDWALVVRRRDLASYGELFDAAKSHLAEKLEEGKKRSDLMIAALEKGAV